MDTEVGEERWRSPARKQWYQEVAIIKVEQADDQLGQVYRLTNHTNQGGGQIGKFFG